jgi:hypothetical protein
VEDAIEAARTEIPELRDYDVTGITLEPAGKLVQDGHGVPADRFGWSITFTARASSSEWLVFVDYIDGEVYQVTFTIE